MKFCFQVSTDRKTSASNLPQSSTPSRLSAKNFVSGSDQAKSSVWDIIFDTLKPPQYQLNTVQEKTWATNATKRRRLIHHLWNTGCIRAQVFCGSQTWHVRYLGIGTTPWRKESTVRVSLGLTVSRINIDTKSHAFGVRLTLFDPISRNHAIQTKYHSFFFKYYNSWKIF